jgi:ElaB/YqjD/DUF883 family membrane-anchored ribosome-binding protein
MANTKKNIPDKISEAVAFLETAVHDKEERVREIAEENLQVLKSTLDEVGPKIEALREKTLVGARRVEDTVRERPWQSLALTAAGAGILGFLFGRSTR